MITRKMRLSMAMLTIVADGYVMTTPVVISNNAEYSSIALNHIGECNVGEEILTIYK